MTSAPSGSTKAKIARRVIEVLDYFDDAHREATVMDIVRRYDRPQSSTSELLFSLVELGLLYKDPNSRCFRLAPRAALIGSTSQQGMVRDGRLVSLIDRLAAQTGLPLAVFGSVGLNVQIVSWHPGPRASVTARRRISSGLQEPLCESAAGWLLLSTIDDMRLDGALRRLNAEASESRKFAVSELSAKVVACRESGHVCGKLGFGSQADVVAVLLPSQDEAQPLAIGIIYSEDDRVSRDSLLRCIQEAIAQALGAPANIEKLLSAA